MTRNTLLIIRFVFFLYAVTVLTGCSSAQLRAISINPVFKSDVPQSVISPGCIGLLTSLPNGDSLVQSITLEGSGSGCYSQSSYPQNQTTFSGGWYSYYDSNSKVKDSYRHIENGNSCLNLIEVRRNFGGPFTLNELLVVETGKLTALEANKTIVLTKIKKFNTDELDAAKAYLHSASKVRFCFSD